MVMACCSLWACVLVSRFLILGLSIDILTVVGVGPLQSIETVGPWLLTREHAELGVCQRPANVLMYCVQQACRSLLVNDHTNVFTPTQHCLACHMQ